MHSVQFMAKAATHWLTGLVVGALLVVAAPTVVSQRSEAATPASQTIVSARPTSTRTTVTTAPTTKPSTAALARLVADGRFAVSVIDLDTSETLTYGSGAFDTASVVKVDILAALLHQAQQDGIGLTTEQKALATAMIEQSDNSAATALFNQVGGKSGLEAFNKLIGLKNTVVGSDGNWGLTRTTAADQIRLLRIVFGDRTVLTASSKAYVTELMSNVEADQNFGVSAAADDNEDAALKVGYLQRSQTGLWDVTSIGRVEAGGHTYLVAVLSEGNATYASGVQLVDAAAKAAVTALA
jgi:beta-lactamase class A